MFNREMKAKLITLLFTVLSVVAHAASGEDNVIVLEGSYQERNVYVINSVSDFGVGFCTYEVKVNGTVTTDNINSSAFEIDLTQYSFEQGSPVFIEIKYKEGCIPKVVNPNVLMPKPTFQCKNIDLKKDGSLRWTVTDEKGALPFVVQQFKWNKWINIGEVMGKGTAGENSYQFNIDLVSGSNKVRVIQKGFNGTKVVSTVATITSDAPTVEWDYNRREQKVTFDQATAYELYDKFGRLKKRGFGTSMDVSNMDVERYWLSFDNVTIPFEKRGN